MQRMGMAFCRDGRFIRLQSVWRQHLTGTWYTGLQKWLQRRSVLPEHNGLAPCVDIVYDARWGRTGETYGEDPFLASALVREAVQGMQEHTDPLKRVAVSVKHLAAGGASVGGVNHASADISERSLRSYILPPFKAAIDAGCMTIMPGHNDIGGVPCHASRWLLTDVIKEEFGFDGFFISDMMDMDNLKTLHHTASDQLDALNQSVNAGMDMHMYSPDSLQFLVPMRLECSSRHLSSSAL